MAVRSWRTALVTGPGTASRKGTAIALAWVTALSVFLSVPFSIGHQEWAMTPDGELYSNIALNLLEGRGFEQDVRNYPIVVPPLYPLFLALVYLVFGQGNVLAVLLIQCLLRACTACLVYLIAKRLFNRFVALIAGTFFAAYSVSIYFGGFVLTETLFTFWVALLGWLCVRLLDAGNSHWEGIWLGLVAGLGCLTRPHLLFLAPAIALWVLACRRRHALKPLVIAALIAAGLVGPWVGYLYVRHGFVIPIASHGALNLWLGNSSFTNPERFYHSQLYADNEDFRERYAYAMSLPFREQYEYFQSHAIQYIIQYPARFVWNTFSKARMFWREVPPAASRVWVSRISLFAWANSTVKLTDRWVVSLFLPGVLLSLLWGFKRNMPLLWIILSYTIAASLAIIVSQGRYRLPIMPLVVVYSSVPIYTGALVASSLARLATGRVKRRIRKG